MGSDERGNDVYRWRDRQWVLNNFWLGRQTTSSTFQAVCSHNYTEGQYVHLLKMLKCYVSIIIIKNINSHLLSPFPQLGTSGSGRTGTCFAAFCPLDSPCWRGKRTWRFSVPCATKPERLKLVNKMSLMAKYKMQRWVNTINQQAHSLSPWKSLCILRRFAPRNADRKRCLHTLRSVPRFLWGSLF